MARRIPEGPPPPPAVQKLRIRYAKRGRLRFSSTRDFARALERALRRSGVPMAFSAGFHPHPKISYANAAPTGTASEAEYFEISVTEQVDPDAVATALDEALPEGLDIVTVVEARPGSLADRLQASRWELRFPGVDPGELETVVAGLLESEDVLATAAALRAFGIKVERFGPGRWRVMTRPATVTRPSACARRSCGRLSGRRARSSSSGWARSDERSAQYEEHRFVVGVAYGSYPCDDVQERAQNGGGDDAEVGRAVVSFGSCFR